MCVYTRRGRETNHTSRDREEGRHNAAKEEPDSVSVGGWDVVGDGMGGAQDEDDYDDGFLGPISIAASSSHTYVRVPVLSARSLYTRTYELLLYDAVESFICLPRVDPFIDYVPSLRAHSR